MNDRKPSSRPHRLERPRGAYLRSFTRLLVGGLEEGLDALHRKLDIWEDQVENPPQRVSRDGFDLPAGPPVETSHPLAEEEVLPSETVADQARYAAIGMVFDAQQKLLGPHETIRHATRLAGRVASPLLRPITAISSSRLLRPARRRAGQIIETLADRGESELERWIDLGRQEDQHSRRLAEAAFDEVMDTSIEYLTTNPEVQELVQTQSSDLANEMIEEVRERTVSADTLLESLARRVFRRVPRAYLPEPSPEVRMGAASIRKSRAGAMLPARVHPPSEKPDE